jgi:hypothetical protein
MKRIGCVVLFLAGCSAQKPMPEVDFSDLAGQDEKSDAFSSKLRLLGTLDEGTTRRVYYTPSPTFRGYKLEGDSIDVWVRSESGDGDALAWLLDESFRVVKKNDDADDTTYDSHIKSALKAGVGHYLVLRDYNYAKGWFSVERAAAASPLLACTGSGLVATIPDACMDDGGSTGVGDSLEVYCFHDKARFCLSGEACPWRAHLPASDDGRTCSHAGIGGPQGDASDPDFMAHTWCQEWKDQTGLRCSPAGQIRFFDASALPTSEE